MWCSTHRTSAESCTKSIKTVDLCANFTVVIAKQLRCAIVKLYKYHFLSLSNILGKSHHEPSFRIHEYAQQSVIKERYSHQKNEKKIGQTTLRVAFQGKFRAISKLGEQISVKLLLHSTFFDMMSHITHPSFAPAWSGASCAQERTGCLGCASTLLHVACRNLLPRGKLYPGRCQN